MDRSMIKGIAIGAISVTAVTAVGVTGFEALKKPASAEVLSVTEVDQTVKTPRQECADVVVQRRAPVQDRNRVAGTVIGAVTGGLLGSTIGHGTGNTVATLAGAAAGGYAGNTIQKQMQNSDVHTATERKCKTAYGTSVKVVGYDVTYRLAGKQGVVRMSHDPGSTIPVKDGKLVLGEAPAG